MLMFFEDAQDMFDLYNISPELTCTCDEFHTCQQCHKENIKEITMEKVSFPESFASKSHPNVPGARQWTYPKTGDTIISIVGGGMGLYGDGVRTFEMYDFREDEPQGYLTHDEINDHLAETFS